MQRKDRLIIRIEKIAFGGEGVGRIDNFVVFVPFAAPEDELEIEIIQCKKKFARGKILKLIKASPLRVKPLCNYYENCGGCCYQHINYVEQLKLKKKQVEEAFIKIGKIAAPPVADVIASIPNYHYRGKAQCHQIMYSEGCKLGFLDISGGKIIDIERCELMNETINEKISRLKKSGLGRNKNKKDARLTLWSELPCECTNEKGQIKRVVKGKEFIVSDDGFFQNNLFITDVLVDEVCRLALSGKIDTVIDVYCGCGLFSIFLASFANEVFGIELNEKAVQFAQINAAKENIKNIRFISGDAGEKLAKKEYLVLFGAVDLLILDPPRVGCDESILQAVARLQPRRLIYISCNPATQARDVKLLNQFGYKLLTLTPVDMFPQTKHIEVVSLLEYQ